MRNIVHTIFAIKYDPDSYANKITWRKQYEVIDMELKNDMSF